MKRGTILLLLFVLMLSLSACSTSANKETSEYATTTEPVSTNQEKATSPSPTPNEPIELHSGVTFGMYVMHPLMLMIRIKRTSPLEMTCNGLNHILASLPAEGGDFLLSTAKFACNL